VRNIGLSGAFDVTFAAVACDALNE